MLNGRTYSKPQKDGNVNPYFQIVAILNSYFFWVGVAMIFLFSKNGGKSAAVTHQNINLSIVPEGAKEQMAVLHLVHHHWETTHRMMYIYIYTYHGLRSQYVGVSKLQSVPTGGSYFERFFRPGF